MTEENAAGNQPVPASGLFLTLVLVAMVALSGFAVYLQHLEKEAELNKPVIGIGVSYNEVIVKSKVLLVKVHPDTPAYKAGLRRGDVVEAVNGEEVVVANDFQSIIKSLPPGSKVELTVLRNGNKLTLVTEVAELKKRNFEDSE